MGEIGSGRPRRGRDGQNGTGVAVGRKNWLFSDTVHGAQASASLYSLIQTARANNVEPYGYLGYPLTELPNATAVEDYERLQPTRWGQEFWSRTL